MGKQYDDAIDFCELTFRNWDPDKFDWKYHSWNLVRYCSDKFDIWWYPEKFNWKCRDSYLENVTKYFCKYLIHKIVIWYTLENIDNYIINKFINKLEWDYE